MQRDIELEATLVAKYAVVAPVLDERSRRRWAAAESRAIGYGGDAVVSSATGLARATIRKGRGEIVRDEAPTDRIRRPGGGRPRIQQDQPGIQAALEALVDPLTRGDPTSPLRWTCKSRAKLAAALTEQGWRVSSTTVGRLLHRLGYRLQSPRKRQEGATHPEPQRAVRAHQPDCRRASERRPAGDFGRHEEEGAGRELQERRAGMAAEGHAASGAGA